MKFRGGAGCMKRIGDDNEMEIFETGAGETAQWRGCLSCMQMTQVSPESHGPLS